MKNIRSLELSPPESENCVELSLSLSKHTSEDWRDVAVYWAKRETMLSRLDLN